MLTKNLLEKFGPAQVAKGIECIINEEQVLLFKDMNFIKKRFLKKDKTGYTKKSRVAQNELVTSLLSKENRIQKFYNKRNEDIYKNINLKRK